MQRRHMVRNLACAGWALTGLRTPTWAGAQSPSPARGVRMVVGAPAGGVADLLARHLAHQLRGSYAPAVVVDNRPGMAGQLAVAHVRDSAPDGCTLLLCPSSMFSVYPHIYPRLPYQLGRDIQPVSLIGYTHFGLVAGPQVPIEVCDVAGFLRWCKAHPQLASYGSPAVGSMAHLVVAAMARRWQVALQHIPYQGSMPGLHDVRGGHIAALCAPLGALLPALHSAQGAGASTLRLLAVSGHARSVLAPHIPTLAEQGQAMAGREGYGVYAPAAATSQVLSHAAACLQAALTQARTTQAFLALGVQAAWSTPQALADTLKADSHEWQGVAREVGFAQDDFSTP